MQNQINERGTAWNQGSVRKNTQADTKEINPITEARVQSILGRLKTK